MMTSFSGSPKSSSRKKARPVPGPKQVHDRYFENPFAPYSGHPLRSQTEYLDDALQLFRDIYHHYSGVNLQEAETDIYTGTVGVAYACWRLLTMPSGALAEADKQMAIGLGTRILDAALNGRSQGDGFLIGEPGVLAVAAIFYNAVGNPRKADDCLRLYAEFSAVAETLRVQQSSGDELFAGRIGYLDGFLELWKVFPNHEVSASVSKTGRRISSK
jgi:hypothetical protein